MVKRLTKSGREQEETAVSRRANRQDAAAASSTCCQHSVRGSNCCQCATNGDGSGNGNGNIIPQPVRNEKMINELPHYLAKINVLRIFCEPRTRSRSRSQNLSQPLGHVAVLAAAAATAACVAVVRCRIINRS